VLPLSLKCSPLILSYLCHVLVPLTGFSKSEPYCTYDYPCFFHVIQLHRIPWSPSLVNFGPPPPSYDNICSHPTIYITTLSPVQHRLCARSHNKHTSLRTSVNSSRILPQNPRLNKRTSLNPPKIMRIQTSLPRRKETRLNTLKDLLFVLLQRSRQHPGVEATA
jgi:hypothetical protein